MNNSENHFNQRNQRNGPECDGGCGWSTKFAPSKGWLDDHPDGLWLCEVCIKAKCPSCPKGWKEKKWHSHCKDCFGKTCKLCTNKTEVNEKTGKNYLLCKECHPESCQAYLKEEHRFCWEKTPVNEETGKHHRFCDECFETMCRQCSQQTEVNPDTGVHYRLCNECHAREEKVWRRLGKQ